MEIRGIKIYIVILVILIIVLGYFGLRYVINQYNVKQPLLNEINNLDGIENVNLNSTDNQQELILEYESDAEFYETYIKAKKIAKTMLDDKFNEIKITNNSNQQLNNFYQEVHFFLYEGAENGNFSDMKQNIDKSAKNNDFDNYKIIVDETNIYFSLIKNNNYFFKIIPRKATRTRGENNG